MGKVLQEFPGAVWVSPAAPPLALFFFGCFLPWDLGHSANLSRCANYPPPLASTARGELNCERLPKLVSDSWSPISTGREGTAEGVTAERSEPLSLCLGGVPAAFCGGDHPGLLQVCDIAKDGGGLIENW